MKELTSLQFANVLRRLGFDLDSVDERAIVLARAGRRVLVPRGRTLEGPELTVLLETAGVAFDTFAAAAPEAAAAEEARAAPPSSGLHLRIEEIRALLEKIR